MSLGIGIDLGGTNIKAALVEAATGQMLHSLSLPTLDGEFENGTPRFAITVRQLVTALEEQAGATGLAVGLSAPGLAAPDGSCITWMPGRMHGLEGLPWSQFLNRKVNVLNDAQAALLGEVWTGAAQGCANVFMITLGTGVGGAVLCDGRLLRGAIGRAGHLGHISVDAMGMKDPFNTPGSLEAAIGNQTLAERGGGAYANTHALVAAATAGDEAARALWLASVRKLAVSIASLINVLDPELVVMGGGISSGAGDHLLAPLRAFLDEYEWRPGGHRARVVLAAGGEWSGALGAARSLL